MPKFFAFLGMADYSTPHAHLVTSWGAGEAGLVNCQVSPKLVPAPPPRHLPQMLTQGDPQGGSGPCFLLPSWQKGSIKTIKWIWFFPQCGTAILKHFLLIFLIKASSCMMMRKKKAFTGHRLGADSNFQLVSRTTTPTIFPWCGARILLRVHCSKAGQISELRIWILGKGPTRNCRNTILLILHAVTVLIFQPYRV